MKLIKWSVVDMRYIYIYIYFGVIKQSICFFCGFFVLVLVCCCFFSMKIWQH